MKGKKFIAIISIVCILAVILCIPAFATVTESDGDGYVLYGGCKLPNIDTVWTDKVTNPYACLFESGEVYVLFLTDYQFVFNGVDVVKPADNYVLAYMCTFDSEFATIFDIPIGVWSPYISESVPDTVGSSFMNWSNYDIINSTNNSVYLAASDPISLDGYNLIEWDGDTTGLTTVGFAHYVLAPYEYAYDALAVWKSSILHVQTDYYTEAPLWAVLASGIEDIASDGIPIVVASDGVYDDVEVDGIAAGYSSNDSYVSLIAYRTVEEPPGEGGDTPDDPQPPFGAIEI